MSDCELTPVPSCTESPCVVGTPAPVASVCPSSNLEDPQQRTLSLEQKTRQLTADIRELQRLYGLLLNNTSAGSTTLQGQITALEILVAANAAAIGVNTTNIATNITNIATNVTNISTNATNIGTNATDIATNAADIAALGTTTVTEVNAATYDIVEADEILHVTYTGTGAVTSITWPSALQISGHTVTIKDAGMNATVNNITIDCEGAEMINSSVTAATLTLASDGTSVTIYSDGSNLYVI